MKVKEIIESSLYLLLETNRHANSKFRGQKVANEYVQKIVRVVQDYLAPGGTVLSSAERDLFTWTEIWLDGRSKQAGLSFDEIIEVSQNAIAKSGIRFLSMHRVLIPSKQTIQALFV